MRPAMEFSERAETFHMIFIRLLPGFPRLFAIGYTLPLTTYRKKKVQKEMVVFSGDFGIDWNDQNPCSS